MFGNVRLAFDTILESLLKYSESGRKALRKSSKALHLSVCLYNKKNITHQLEDLNFIFWWQEHSYIKLISSRHRDISSIYCANEIPEKRRSATVIIKSFTSNLTIFIIVDFSSLKLFHVSFVSTLLFIRGTRWFIFIFIYFFLG